MPTNIASITQSELKDLLEDVYALVDTQQIYYYDVDFSNTDTVILRPNNTINASFVSHVTTEALYNEDDSIVYLANNEGFYKKYSLLQKYEAVTAPPP